MEDILVRLGRGEIIVGDGALGTMLMKYVSTHGEPPEMCNLTKSHLVEEIASSFLDAGAEIVTTNTFGASPLRLRKFSLDKEADQINRRAVETARKVVESKAYVSGSVGPSAQLLKPLGKTDPEEIYASFRQQINTLISSGVDIICIETMTDIAEAVIAINAVRSLDSKIPVMATITFMQNPRGFFTIMGTSVKNAAETLEKAGANIIGSNCGNGSEQMVLIAEEFKKHSRLPVAIQTNAGLPKRGDKGVIYPETPEFLAGRAKEMLNLGVQIIGGCCGTEPEHIRAIRQMVDAHLKNTQP
jgi:5-methyltetrahydrofolate--homocysteine methyltransferase